MKIKKMSKKLTLNKRTVTNLNNEEMKRLKAGVYNDVSCIPSTCPGCLFPSEVKVTNND